MNLVINIGYSGLITFQKKSSDLILHGKTHYFSKEELGFDLWRKDCWERQPQRLRITDLTNAYQMRLLALGQALICD